MVSFRKIRTVRMPQRWEVIGGADKGGILVREGQATSTTQLADRLSTGALVEELELVGDRLHYKRLTGTGPAEGWVSVKLTGKELCIKTDKAPPNEKPDDAFGPAMEYVTPPEDLDPDVPPALPAPPRPAQLTPVKPLPAWYRPSPPKGKTAEHLLAVEMKGEFYHMEFPFTIAMLKENKWGASWLTKAFQKAGTLPTDNRITKVVGIKELPMSGYDAAGGAGLKAFLTVEYSKPNPALHTKLFVKVPFPAADNMQWRMNMSFFGDPDGAELSVYQFLAHLLPFKIPKLYFCDIARPTTNYIIITEQVLFSPKGHNCAPYEIYPAIGKYQDFDLKNPVQPYYALMRAMARMAAWDKQGRFEGVREIFEHTTYARMGGREKVLTGLKAQRETRAKATKEEIRKYEVTQVYETLGSAQKRLKNLTKHTETLVDFVSNIAPWLFPDDVREPEFLGKLVEQFSQIFVYNWKISSYCNDDPLYQGLIHPNLQCDNAYFWNDEEGTLHAGLFDWGGCGYMSYSGVFLGCLTTMLPEIYLEHEEKLFR